MGQQEVLLEYHPNLYLGEGIKKKKLDKIKKKLENRPLFSGVFLITFSRNPSDQLEIYEAKQLCQQYYNKYPPHVIGIAGSREEALQMIEQMAKECFRARGDCALKEYLRC